MSDAVLEEQVWDVLYLAKCAVDGLTPAAERVQAMDLDAVWKTANEHTLSSVCATALESAGVHDERFVQARGKAVRKTALMDAERTTLCSHLEEAGIWYLPLKGCVIQGLYPLYGMRQMSDNDILVDPNRREDIRDIMLSMGFTCMSFGKGAEDVYHKEPVCNFELHCDLFTPAFKKMAQYYADMSRLMLPDGDSSYAKRLSDEDFYVYVIAHEYKHYIGFGIGLRSLLDTYVYLKAKASTMDWDYISAQLEQMDLADFERSNRELALAVFSEEGRDAVSPEQEKTLAYMETSGTYGILEHKVGNFMSRQGRLGYLIDGAFPSYERMAYEHPSLKRLPILLPFFWGKRLAWSIATKPQVVAYQLKAFFVQSKQDNEEQRAPLSGE